MIGIALLVIKCFSGNTGSRLAGLTADIDENIVSTKLITCMLLMCLQVI